MKIITKFDQGDLVWVKYYDRYLIGKVLDFYSWDSTSGPVMDVLIYTTKDTSVKKHFHEDTLTPYENKEELINKVFIADSPLVKEYINKNNEETIDISNGL